MAGLCEGRVAIVTGAGRGIGREHALMLASEGARVVVNDLGSGPDGAGSDLGPAKEVVAAIEDMGGEAIVNGADITNFDDAGRMVAEAVEAFGRLDVLVNNAGILRDRMVFSMSEAEWDAVVGVHLKGHFCPTRHAAAHWRERSKAGDNVGQANYGAAKAGIAALTMVSALELARYGVSANCLAPTAITRLVAPVMGGEKNIPQATKEALAPRWVAAVATWLASPASRGVTGRVFDVRGDRIVVAEGWHRGPEAPNDGTPEGVGAVMADLLAAARPNADLDGNDAPDRY